MSPDIAPYKDIILSLAPMANHSTFNSAFDKRTHDVAKELKFVLKMEVKRLAKPCIRSIDLRQTVNDKCSLYKYEGTKHYLNDSAIHAFEKLAKRYGEYTFGVYEGVLEFAEKEVNRQKLVKVPPALPHLPEIDVSDKFITPCQELLNFPTRKEERLNYVVSIEVFFQDNTSAHATTIDISVSGLKIRFKDPKSLHNLRIAKLVHVVFQGMDKATGVNKERIEYEILGLSGIGAKTCIHLYRTSIKTHSKFNDHITTLVRQFKRRYKVNLDNIEMALSSKIYEQNFANTNTSLPVFLGENGEGKLGPVYMSFNGCAKKITDYWLNEKYQQMLGYLFSPERVRYLLKLPEGESTSVFCFHHIDKEKIYFYSAFIHELEEQPKLAETFLAYGSRRVSWRVFNITMQRVNSGDAYIPTSLPDTVSRTVARANKPPSPRLLGRINKIKGIASMTDATNAQSQAYYQRRKLVKSDIRLLKYFGHPRNKPPMVIDAYRHKQQDLRRQARYIMRTPIIVSSRQTRIHGFTEDISISGLRLQLDQPFEQRRNTKVTISFPKLNDMAAGFDLTALTYRVRDIKADKCILHLQADEDELSNSKPFFSELIQNNTDKLQSLHQDEKIQGMSIALRNLHARSSSQVCIYIEKKPEGFVPAMTTANNKRAKWFNVIQEANNKVTFDVKWLFADDDLSSSFVRNAISTLSPDAQPLYSEVFVAFDPNSTTEESSIRALWDYQLPSHRSKIRFIQQAQKTGVFFSLLITVNKAMRPDTEILEQELYYLSQQAIHKASHFEERMWDIAATLFITDITQETLFRYQISKGNENP